MTTTNPALKRRLYPVPEAAHYLGISVRSMNSLLSDGEVLKVRIGGRTLVDEHDLDDYIERRKKAAL
ncbi:MAG TPA: helix-turn-helix domain-containing protein [Acidimicrobiales bacterium]|nr:helix-turn-helix domain-containing protein [Acidimicrobiales bacterium]